MIHWISKRWNPWNSAAIVKQILFNVKWQGHSVTHPLFPILWLAKVMIIQKKAMNQIWKFKNKTLLRFGFLATGIYHKSLVIWNFVSGKLPTVDNLFHEKPFVLVEIIFFRSKFVENWPPQKTIWLQSTPQIFGEVTMPWVNQHLHLYNGKTPNFLVFFLSMINILSLNLIMVKHSFIKLNYGYWW